MELDEDGISSYILVNSFGWGKLHFVSNQNAISADIIGTCMHVLCDLCSNRPLPLTGAKLAWAPTLPQALTG